MLKVRLAALALLLIGAGIGWFVIHTQVPGSSFAFRYGLDLEGGSHLVYQADVSKVDPSEVSAAMQSLRDVIERRVNIFGVSEPVVQTERGGITGTGDERLIVELPGITNLSDAVAAIGSTPVLEFRLQQNAATGTVAYVATGLTGAYLSHASLEFSSGRAGTLANQPIIALQFNTDGAERFKDITTKNVGRQLGIFLDGQLISSPVIQEAIPNGQATITGSFTPQEARDLVRNLNFGALPVPISLISSQSVGASLGAQALSQSVMAGLWGFLMVGLFLLLWYRLPGLVAIVALCIYIALSLAIFKMIPVTLTVAGLAGFVLSIGMAVDANILIFERTKEELRGGKPLQEAIHEGFHRAWTSIRDSNLSSILTGIILYWLGGTAIIKGFALVFVIGVLVSMFTAVTVTRTFLISLGFGGRESKLAHFLFGSGVSK
ncbi:protein translocase subunit SecD [Candidatus Kaiserbacteria bacterium]|nr:protein translocase subunit SecD [Candidatus Kaiserbacteria bacterium]